MLHSRLRRCALLNICQLVWPLGLVALGALPFAIFANANILGGAVGKDAHFDADKSPSAVMMETLRSIRTIAALCLEEKQYRECEKAVEVHDLGYRRAAFLGGLGAGVTGLIQQWFAVSGTGGDKPSRSSDSHGGTGTDDVVRWIPHLPFPGPIHVS